MCTNKWVSISYYKHISLPHALPVYHLSPPHHTNFWKYELGSPLFELSASGTKSAFVHLCCHLVWFLWGWSLSLVTCACCALSSTPPFLPSLPHEIGLGPQGACQALYCWTAPPSPFAHFWLSTLSACSSLSFIISVQMIITSWMRENCTDGYESPHSLGLHLNLHFLIFPLHVSAQSHHCLLRVCFCLQEYFPENSNHCTSALWGTCLCLSLCTQPGLAEPSVHSGLCECC